MTRLNASAPRGLLQRGATAPNAGHRRILPIHELGAHIEHFWIVRWDLRGQPPQVAETIPHPSVYWITENRTTRFHGVPTDRFTRTLKGTGRVFGVKFRPGGFYPFLRAPVSNFTNSFLSVGQAFGADGRRVAAVLKELSSDALEATDATAADERMMGCVERFLLDRLPAPDPQLGLVSEIVGAIVRTQEITKVEQLVASFDMSKRALQRLFNTYVGVSPKWVIKRYRLHEAVERVARGDAINWSRLALELGYFDQTHFIKDFKALIGRSPGEYAKTIAR